jgi:N-acetyl-anhydromuramyl-L-alanine amidase AmpD
MLRQLILACAGLACGSVHAAEPSAAPQIVPREQWGAKPAVKELMKPQKQAAIVVHHTSSRRQPKVSLEKKLKGLQSFSQREDKVAGKKKPAWGDVPYHYYIDASGRVGEGRNINFAGDTNTSYDPANNILIVVEGDFESEMPSGEQKSALKTLVVWLARNYKIPASRITGHNDQAQTDCPGKNLKPFLEDLRKAVSGG